MYSLLVVVCFLLSIVLAVPSDFSTVEVIRPKTLTPKQHDDEVIKFWTPEKFLVAKTLNPVPPAQNLKVLTDTGSVANGPPSSVKGSLPSASATTIKVLN